VCSTISKSRLARLFSAADFLPLLDGIWIWTTSVKPVVQGEMTVLQVSASSSVFFRLKKAWTCVDHYNMDKQRCSVFPWG
jgi:hypothetical protein